MDGVLFLTVQHIHRQITWMMQIMSELGLDDKKVSLPYYQDIQVCVNNMVAFLKQSSLQENESCQNSALPFQVMSILSL